MSAYLRPEPEPLPALQDRRTRRYPTGAAILAAWLGGLLVISTPTTGADRWTLVGWVLLVPAALWLAWRGGGWIEDKMT